MKNYHMAILTLDGRTITPVSFDTFSEAEELLSDYIAATDHATFIPLAEHTASWFIHKNLILEISIQDDEGNKILEAPEDEGEN